MNKITIEAMGQVCPDIARGSPIWLLVRVPTPWRASKSVLHRYLHSQPTGHSIPADISFDGRSWSLGFRRSHTRVLLRLRSEVAEMVRDSEFGSECGVLAWRCDRLGGRCAWMWGVGGYRTGV